MPLLCLQICDSQGFPFYNRNYAQDTHIDGNLLSGMVSAIGNLGKTLFKQDIATVAFGSGDDATFMVVVAKDLYFEEKSIYFVFYLKGECNHQMIKEISTTLFIENKVYLRSPEIDVTQIRQRIDTIIETKFHNLIVCFN